MGGGARRPIIHVRLMGGGGGGDTGVPISHIPDFLPPQYPISQHFLPPISHIPDFVPTISHIPDVLPPNIPYPRFHYKLTISQILQD